VSTEWHFFALDAQSFERHVASPILAAAERRDAEGWFALLTKLSSVYPASSVTRFGLNGADRPITSVDWYTGRGDLPVDTPPSSGSVQLLALVKLAAEALAEFHLAGSCSGPSAVFAELGYPASLADPSERDQFARLAALFFEGRRSHPPAYRFVRELNQRADIAFASEIQAFVECESRVGLLSRLSRDLSTGVWRDLAVDLRHLQHFLLLAESRGLAVYYREDAT
jgi:hypothetical protein